MGKPRLLEWDWKAQPDIKRLSQAVESVSEGTCFLHEVNTHGDSYGVLVAEYPLEPEEAQAEWERLYMEDDNHV